MPFDRRRNAQCINGPSAGHDRNHSSERHFRSGLSVCPAFLSGRRRECSHHQDRLPHHPDFLQHNRIYLGNHSLNDAFHHCGNRVDLRLARISLEDTVGVWSGPGASLLEILCSCKSGSTYSSLPRPELSGISRSMEDHRFLSPALRPVLGSWRCSDSSTLAPPRHLMPLSLCPWLAFIHHT